MPERTSKNYYKILRDGRSFNGGALTWSLPARGKPGEWHEVSGPLVRCSNGLHLTSEPTYRRITKTVCYLAEFEGETLGPFSDELVVRRCRLVRRVPWPELATTDPEAPPEPSPEEEGESPEEEGESPALVLLRHAWEHNGHGMGRSWRRINSAMQAAFRLAIVGGFRFDKDDLAVVARDFNPGYWWGDLEQYYSLACDGDHGPSPSAYQAIEAFKKRTPWLVMEEPGEAKARLHLGRRFRWFDHPEDPKPKEGHWVFVTSFDDKDDLVIACSYKDASRSKIDRRFRITRDEVAAYHKAVARLKKEATEKSAVPATES
jgi:hypothetical protein